jgi:hypothetical protein
MAQNIGDIRVISLLGWARMCHTAPESRTAGPNRTYRRNALRSWAYGTPWIPRAPGRREHLGRPWSEKRDPRKDLRGTEVLEAIMAGVLAIAAVALFLAGVVVGVLFVVAREIRREDRLYSLADEAPSLMSRGTRRLTGFGRRDLQMRVLTAGRRAAA